MLGLFWKNTFHSSLEMLNSFMWLCWSVFKGISLYYIDKELTLLWGFFRALRAKDRVLTLSYCICFSYESS